MPCLFLTLGFIILYFFTYCKSERRIVLGTPSVSDKGFVVYLMKSNKSNMISYDSWICGGTLVSSTHILTAAACVTDVTHLYAIAGYRKYVRTEYLDVDPCTKTRKKRIVKTCMPKRYNFNYGKASRWIGLDIAFAIVESPYNFSDLTYRMDCSYVPRALPVNFDPMYVADSENVMIYGWGHTRGLRVPGDPTNYNTEYLQEASTKMISKAHCQKYFADESIKKSIEKYIICTMGIGNLNSNGEVIDQGNIDRHNGCRRRQMLDPKVKCGEDDYDIDLPLEFRRNGTDMDPINITNIYNFTMLRENMKSFRRQGICQNDHGGPLVVWVGSSEMVAGVASASLYDKHLYCIAPSLFTSTQCVMRFIMCGLQIESPMEEQGRKMCEDLKKTEGYELHHTDMDWTGYDEKPKQSEDQAEHFNSDLEKEKQGINNNENDTKLVNEQNYAVFKPEDSVEIENDDDNKDEIKASDNMFGDGDEYVKRVIFDTATDDVIMV